MAYDRVSRVLLEEGSKIENKTTGETFHLADGKMKPLEIAARLVIEDINILLPIHKLENGKLALSNKDERIDGFHLVASATLFPAGWNLKERISWTIQELHRPVPYWDMKLGIAVLKTLKKIAFGVTPTGKPAPERQRLAVFPQADQPGKTLGDLLCVQNGDDFFPVYLRPIAVEQMIFRREKQCFLRLKSVNGILFTVRTYLSFPDETEASELEGLIRQILMLPEDHAAYKQLDIWYPCMRDYCAKLGIDCNNLRRRDQKGTVREREQKEGRSGR